MPDRKRPDDRDAPGRTAVFEFTEGRDGRRTARTVVPDADDAEARALQAAFARE